MLPSADTCLTETTINGHEEQAFLFTGAASTGAGGAPPDTPKALPRRQRQYLHTAKFSKGGGINILIFRACGETTRKQYFLPPEADRAGGGQIPSAGACGDRGLTPRRKPRNSKGG